MSRIEKICQRAGITRMTFYRHKKKPGFPGMDVSDTKIVNYLKANVGKSTGKRKAKKKQTPKTTKTQTAKTAEPSEDLVLEMDEPDEDLILNREKKRADIDYRYAQTRKLFDKAQAEYRAKVVKRFSEALDILFREIARLDLEPDQLEKIENAARDAAHRVENVD